MSPLPRPLPSRFSARLPSHLSVRFLLHACALCLAAMLFLQAGHAISAEVPPPTLAAKAWVLVDVASGQTLASENADVQREPASLTKLMTAYLAFQALKEKRLTLDQTVPVPASILKRVSTEETRTFLQPDLPVTVEELLKGMIVQSGNDASVLLAEAIGGTETVFVELMNRQAQRLGMKNTHFHNAAGMPAPDHYSTARDLAVLATHLVQDFPDFYKYYSLKEFSYNKVTQPNRNRLLWLDPNVDGMKTGYTESAGYCLISSSKRGDRRLVSVVMGTSSDAMRAQESLKLLNYGFQNFDTVRIYKKDEPLATPQVWKGQAEQVRLGLANDVWVTLPKGQAGQLKPVLERTQPLVAPLQAGQSLGRLKLMLGDKVVAERPIIALDTVQLAGFFDRSWDSLRLWLKHKGA